MQSIRRQRFKVALAAALLVFAGIIAAPHAVWAIALSVSTRTIDLADNLVRLPCRIAESFRTLPERMNPTCSECSEP
jgi:hypothetical protein